MLIGRFGCSTCRRCSISLIIDHAFPLKPLSTHFTHTGGSPDGLRSHKTAERFDPREGRWQPLPSMVTPRGYW